MTEFHRKGAGRHSYCKPCHSGRTLELRELKHGAPDDSAGEPYCPALSLLQVEKGLKTKLYQLDENGDLERKCAVCGDYWPADTAFFFPLSPPKIGLRSECRACYLEMRKVW